MIKFRCFRCTHRLHTSDRNAGKVVRCPSCKELAFVPSTANEIEAALAAARGEVLEHDAVDQATEPTAWQSPPPHGRATGVQRGLLKLHNYVWLQFIASAYFALGVVLSLVGGAWFVWQIRGLVSSRVGPGPDVFESCLWFLGGVVVVVTLFAASQVIFAFRDMVQNSWVTREVAALPRSLTCQTR